MNKKSLYVSRDGFINFLIILNWLMAMVYYIVVPVFHSNSITQPVIVAGCLLSTVIWLLALTRKNIDAVNLIVFILCVLIVLFKGFIGKSFTSVDGIYSLIAFINILGFFLTYKNISLSKKSFDFIYYIAVFLTILFFVYSFTGIAYRCDSSQRVYYSTGFAFNLNNPNAAAMHLYGIFCILLVNLDQRKYKIINLALCGILVYLIIRTNCRSCIISVVALVLYMLFFKKKKFSKPVVFIVSLSSAFFLIFYLLAYSSGYENIMIGNKYLFSGRQNVYNTALRELKTPFTILFGAVRAEYFYNAHNAFLSLLSSIGIAGTICYYFLLLRSFFDINQKSNITLTCFLGLSIQACAESAMFMGNFPFIMFIVLLLLLGEYKPGFQS